MLRVADVPQDGASWSNLPPGTRLVRSSVIDLALVPPLPATIKLRLERTLIIAPVAFGRAMLTLGSQRPSAVTLQHGCLWHAPPETEITYMPQEPAELVMLAAELEKVQALGDFFDALAAAEQSCRHIEVPEPGIRALAAELRRSLLGDRFTALSYLQWMGEALLLRLLCLSLDVAPSKSHVGLTGPVLARTLQRIEDSLIQPPTVAELAMEAGMTRSHFTRAFTKAVGDPPARYVAQRRLCRARAALVETDQSIATIAAKLGYASHGHLTAAFRSELGQTPSSYRKAARTSLEVEE